MYCQRTDSDADQPMDYSSVSFGRLHFFSGAAHLHVSDADLYLRHLDRLLPQLTLPSLQIMSEPIALSDHETANRARAGDRNKGESLHPRVGKR